MKSLKDNSIVKWVYAYVDLLLKALPILFVFALFPFLFFGESDARRLDFFNLFNALRNNNLHSLTWLIVIPAFNIVVFITLYLTLKRLVVFIKNVFDEKPFEEENGKNLKFVGMMVIIIAVFFHIAAIVSVQNSKIADLSWETEMLVNVMGFLSIAVSPYLFSGLLLIVIGEVILHGVRMKQEIDLTV